MILKPTDWKLYPEARPDFTTKNQSFLEMAQILRDLGVEKNWFLPLALHDQKLVGVDPFDPDLSPEYILRVAKEFCSNPWYAFRECIQVPIDGGDPVPFKINRGTFALYWCFFSNIDGALEFLRQHGKTVGISGLFLYLTRILENARSILITKDPKLRAETIEKLKHMRDHLPPGIWVTDPKDPDNQETFGSVARNTKLITAIGQNNPASANSQGRGLTAGRLGSDEGPFTPYIHIILPAAFGSGVAARKANEAEGVPYANFFVTTPGELDSPEGSYMYNLMTSGIKWDERYIDLPTRKELLELIDKNSAAKVPRRIFYIKFNHNQLGTSDDELFDMIRNASGTPEQIARDYGGRWTAGRMTSPLSETDAKILKEHKIKPLWKEIFSNRYILNWYIPRGEVESRMAAATHVIGLDTSEGVGRDSLSLTMVNSETLETSADSEINETNIIRYADWLGELLIKYPKTVLVIERKSTGSVIVDALLEKLSGVVKDLHHRLYCNITQFKDVSDPVYKQYVRGPGGRLDDFWMEYRKEIGFKTDGGKRKTLYGEVFGSAIATAKKVARSEILIDQLLALVVKRERIDHINSGHDDMVVAWLLAFWFIFLAKNTKFYGVDQKRARLKADFGGDISVDEEERIVNENEEQLRVLDEIEVLYEMLSTTRDVITKVRLETKLRTLVSKTSIKPGAANTLSDYKELIKAERFRRRLSR